MKDIETSFISPFVGRRNELNRITRFFTDNKKGVLQITGIKGIGKTSLAHLYADRFSRDGYSFFRTVYSGELFGVSSDMEYEGLGLDAPKALIIINDVEQSQYGEILELASNYDIVHIITTSINPIIFPTTAVPVKSVELSAFSRNEAYELLSLVLSQNIDENVFTELMNFTGGNPRLIKLFLNICEENGLKEINKFLYADAYSLIKDHIGETQKSISAIQVGTSTINHQMMEYLANNPSAIHALTPREFEEMVAHLYHKLGYEVELTKATRDGGKDIYVAQKTDVGSFLYIVECKHYNPGRAIGVEVIRNLYGVMGMDSRRPNHGIIATTSYFSKDAKKEIKVNNLQHQITLQDFQYLSKLLNKAYGKNNMQ